MDPILLGALAAQLVCAAAPASAAYDDAIARLSADREKLAASYRAARTAAARREVLEASRARVLDAIDRELIPAWFGTPWEFYGHSERPQEGTIACGYFVSTVLRDTGFRVPRVLLAQQASERIVRTLAPEARVARLRNVAQAEVVAQVRKKGDGLYVIGLDFHVGFLRLDGAGARFCHSSYLGPRAVTCEKAEEAPAMSSGYYVAGEILGEERLVDWLLQRPIPLR